MKQLVSFSSLVFFIMIIVLTQVGCTPEPNDFPVENIPDSTRLVEQKNGPCPQREAGFLPEPEARILNSTVCVYLQTWVVESDETGYQIYDSFSHATVKDGRYLVTHNHTDIPLSIRHRDGDPESYTKVFLYNAAGELQHEGPLSDFSIVAEDVETLVLEHKEEGFLESIGFSSAEFRSWEQLPLDVGMMVAQVDWDEMGTRVDWVTIKDIEIENGVPRIMLSDGVMVGASGGGIFCDGYHIANNWRAEEQLDGAGYLISQITTAALNSSLVVGETNAN